MRAEKYIGYKDKAKRRAYMREYMRARWKQKGPSIWRSYYQRIRAKAMEVLGGPICRKCGCDEERILEINHKNGGGSKERRVTDYAAFYRAIVLGRIDKRKLDILCRVCNALHYVKTILGIGGHSVVWKVL